MPKKDILGRLQLPISKLLNDTLDAKVEMHAILTDQENHDSAIAIPSFTEGYNQAIKTIYDVICFIEGLECEKGQALEKGLKFYLETKK